MKSLLFAAACAVALAGWAHAPDGRTGGPGCTSPDSTHGGHGMLLFGGEGEGVYLSHLPLYSCPHDWQMILRARLVGEGEADDPMAAYLADRRESGEEMYTIDPELFEHSILEAVAEGGPVRFRADVVRGHFERGGTTILEGVTVEVTRVVVRRMLDAGEADPEEGRYLLFGSGGETFLAHRIAGAPDFDQVVRVELPEEVVSAEDLAAGIPVTIAGPGDRPLRQRARVSVRTDAGGAFRARVGEQVYLEFGDLEG
jgi:hypothetical protein